MVDEPVQDDSSYYEISITAGQAFLAVVLMIASLAAAFAFGIVVGQARGGTRTITTTRPPVIVEGGSEDRGTIVELGVEDEPFSSSTDTVLEESELIEETTDTVDPADPAGEPAGDPVVEPTPVDPSPAVPHFAQILSTTDRESAERLAARLIDADYTGAYVERAQTDGGMLYRVRIRFGSEAEARAAVAGLRGYAPGEIWISRTE